MEITKKIMVRGHRPLPNTIHTAEGVPVPKLHLREAKTVDHSVKQYIDESLPVQLKKSKNLMCLRRLKSDLITMYKILHGLVAVDTLFSVRLDDTPAL